MTRGRARIAIAALLASVAAPALATSTATASGDVASGAQLPTDQTKSNDEAIYITAPPLFHDVQPERSLDQDAIDSYGASTVDEILGDLQVELGEDAEQPLLIVNGHRVSDLSDIGALPVEVLRNIVVLPRGAALRAGGTGTQRVISITLKRTLRQATVTAAHKISTDGNWNGERGEAMLTHVKGDTRANVAFRMRDETPLLESQRGIIQPSPFFPYAISGNIIGFPDTSGEIDPALSALAGQPVFVVPLPASAPTLQQLAGLANQQNVTDLGAFRTLRPKTRNYDLNGTFATRLAPWLTANATLHWYRNDGDYLRGLPGALFVLSPSNPFSPFSNSVGVAVYGKRPLHSISTQNAADANATFNANWGLWQGNLNLRRSQSTFDFKSQRATAFGPIPLDDSLDPFATDLSNLIALRTDSTSSRSTDTLADLTLNGSAFHLPAGDVTAVLEGRVEANHLHSTSTFVGSGDQRLHRNSQSVRGGIDIPLTSRENAFLPEAGELSASIELSRAHFSDAGSINHATYGLTWEPAPPVRFHGSIDRTDLPAPIQTLGNPVTITPQVRVFDPLTGETVDVTEITGGIPSLRPQSTKTRDVSALLRLVPKMSLELNAEYIDTDVRNFVSSLPQASAAVELAFPQRFIRDAKGVLTTIDLRPVNFDSHRDKRLRWGLSMNTKIGSGVFGGPTSPGMPRPAYRPPTYLQLTFNHTMVFSDQIVIRPGLDSVDLLRGGAMGIGGGRVRHQIDSTMAVTSGGLGVRMGVTWRAASELVSQFGGVTDTLHFSPLLAINLKAFTDVKRLLPHDRWAKGLRLSVDVINALNRRQTVHDSFGSTPLQYQPAYRDPLGRTVEIELRKVF